MAQLNFNANTVEPAQAMEPIPANWYDAQVVASEIKATSNGLGSFVSLTIEILGGAYNKRKVFDRFNIVNANPTAVEIAYRSLSALCHAVNVIDMQDTQQLHGRPFQVKVSLRAAGTGSDGKFYDAQNEVKGYKATGAGAAGGAPVAGAPAAAPAWAAQAAAAPQAPAAAPAAPAMAWAPAPVAQAPAPAAAPVAPAAAAPAPPWAVAAPVAGSPAAPAAATPPWAQQPAGQ
jgi:hypothetical protein